MVVNTVVPIVGLQVVTETLMLRWAVG